LRFQKRTPKMEVDAASVPPLETAYGEGDDVSDEDEYASAEEGGEEKEEEEERSPTPAPARSASSEASSARGEELGEGSTPLRSVCAPVFVSYHLSLLSSWRILTTRLLSQPLRLID
jgi:hypothetical protein